MIKRAKNLGSSGTDKISSLVNESSRGLRIKKTAGERDGSDEQGLKLSCVTRGAKSW